MKRKTIILTILIAACIISVMLPATVNAVGEPIAIAVEVNSFGSGNTGSSTANTLLRTEGTAAATGGVLRLVTNTQSQAGTVVRRNQIQLTNGFSTYFQFKIASTSTPADGLVLVVYQSDTVKIGEYGGGLGYSGIGNSIGVEFDAYYNGDYNDPSAYHAAIMVDGNVNHSGQPAGSMASNSNINNGTLMHVWVDYDGTTVTATFGTGATRSDGGNTTISRNVGNALVGKNVFMGFSASTGGSYANHDILKWYFKDSYVSGGLSSSSNAYTQGASTLGITLNSSSADPASATINVYDAAGAVMANQSVDVYMDGTLATTGNTGTSGYTYTISGLSNGSHTLRAVAAGGASNYASFTVTAYPPTIQSGPSAQSASTGQTAAFNVSAASPDGGTLSYQWQVDSGSGFTDIGGTNSPSYTTGTLSVSDNGKKYRCIVTNTKDGKAASATSGEAVLTVNRLTGTIEITGDPAKTYDGNPASDPAVTKTTDGAVSYSYYADNGGSIGEQLAGAPANAGTYWVRATAAQTDTYAQVSADKKFAIGRKPIDTETQAKLLLTCSLASKIYNASPQPVSVSVAPGVTGLGAVTVYYEGTGGTVYAKSTTAPTSAGTYTVLIDIAQGGNYGSFANLTLGEYTIEKASITGVTTADYSGTYDGKTHGISFTGLPDGASVAYRTSAGGEYSLSENPTYTDIGTYTVYYRITRTNYYDLEGSRTVVINPKALTDGMVAGITGTFIYSGVQQIPEPVVSDGDPSIIKASDYLVSYTDNIYPGTATVTVSAAAGGNYSGEVSKTFTIDKKALDASMIGEMEDLVWNGAAQTPVPVVKDGNPSALNPSDYTVSYSDNVNAGTASVTVTATEHGNYSGSASRNFIIKQKELSSDMIAEIAAVTYNGAAYTPALTVTDGTPSIIKASDYTVGYSDNINAGTATATITAAAGGNYSGSASRTFTINKKELSSGMIAAIEPATYNGAAYIPALTVTDGIPSIIADSDYTVSYSDNVNAGTASVTVTATEHGNYSGSASRNFIINPKELSPDMIAEIAAVTYNGAANTPALTVADGTPSIIKASDYTVGYSDNINAGTATATITAASGGNYTGSASRTFTINKKELSADMIAEIVAETYNGVAHTPALTIADGKPSIIKEADYTVRYSDNILAGIATATITAAKDGNYTGSAGRTFTIKQKELSPEMIAEIAAATYNGAAYTPALTVADGTPSIIAAADYTVSYSNNIKAGTATATITATETGNYTGSASRPFTVNKKALTQDMIAGIASESYNGAEHTPGLSVADGTPSIIAAADYTVSYSDNVRAGTATATITATAGGNYSGYAARTFPIVKKQLTADMIGGIAAVTYDGEPQKPVLAVTDGNPSILSAADYTVAYAGNTAAGTATATILAASNGNYYGSASKNFTINTAQIKGSVSIPSAAEKGRTLRADVSGIQPESAQSSLVYQWNRDGAPIPGAAGSSYTVVEADTGHAISVAVTGKGNYSGSITSGNASVSLPKIVPQITLSAPVFGKGTVTIGGTVKMPGMKFTTNVSYKKESASTWTVIENGNYTGEKTFEAGLSGLEESTVYVWRITVTGEDGKTYVSTGRFLTPKSGTSTAKGSISGTVGDDSGMEAMITVTVEKGNTVIASASGLRNGDTFSFTKLPDGIYNVVASNGTYRVTQIITIQNGEVVAGVSMTIGQRQSVVEIKTEDTPDIAVGGLNDLFNDETMFTTADALLVENGGTVEIKLVAEKHDAANIDGGDKEKIEGIANGDIALYLDLSVLKTVYDSSDSDGEQTRLTELPTLIEVVIPIPENLKGLGTASIYRVHNGAAEMLPVGMENANADGEYCVVGSDYITLYIRKFSTYAVGFAGETQSRGVFQTYWWLPVILVAVIVAAALIVLRKEKKNREYRGE